MQEQNTRNPTPRELVGTKDLREAFKERSIRGSFFINGVEMHQFEANSPAVAIALINAKTSAHHITAEIDDQGRLVLTDMSGADVMLRDGAPWMDTPPLSTGDAAKDISAQMRHDREKEQRSDEPAVLEQLGLPVTDKTDNVQGAQPGFGVGRSAEERQKAHDERRGVAPAAQPQTPDNPTPGDTGGSQGRLSDGRGRTGTGGGSGEAKGETVQRAVEQHTGKPGQ